MLDFQSSGMQPTFTIPLHKSNIHCVPVSPVAYMISAITPDKPGACCLYASFFSAAATSSVLMQSAGFSLKLMIIK